MLKVHILIDQIFIICTLCNNHRSQLFNFLLLVSHSTFRLLKPNFGSLMSLVQICLESFILQL